MNVAGLLDTWSFATQARDHVDTIEVARSARRRAVENFGFSAAYNLVAAPAAMLGLVNPFVAALAMSGSSLIVSLNALRIGGRR